MPLSEHTRERAREIVDRYPQSRSALLPMLHLVQAEEGFVGPDGIELCARELGLTKAEVLAVATFYTMYKRRPVGEYLVSVCTNLSCQVLGGEEAYAAVSEHLGVGHDETAPGVDGGPAITLEHAECLAACDFAPVMTVNYEFYDNVTPGSALGTVQELQAGRRPLPTRGAPLCSFREISLQLAGFFPDDVVPTAEQDAARAGAGAPAHPDAPAPVDSRGTVSRAGTDVDERARDFGVPGGEPERTLDASDAADTYAVDGPADGGATPEAVAEPPRRDEDTALAGQPQDAAPDEETQP